VRATHITPETWDNSDGVKEERSPAKQKGLKNWKSGIFIGNFSRYVYRKLDSFFGSESEEQVVSQPVKRLRGSAHGGRTTLPITSTRTRKQSPEKKRSQLEQSVPPTVAVAKRVSQNTGSAHPTPTKPTQTSPRQPTRLTPWRKHEGFVAKLMQVSAARFVCSQRRPMHGPDTPSAAGGEMWGKTSHLARRIL